MKKLLLFASVFVLLMLLACGRDQSIRLVTTTSVENSGLLSYLTPHFEEETGFEVDVIAKGTGAAIKTAEDGQADVLLVHDREKELAFMDAGYGEKRHELMYNHFVFLGPEPLDHDGTLSSFLNEIHGQEPFISRGDESGTHAKEKFLWEEAGLSVSTEDDWYDESGQGMESTLSMATLKGYYTLSDRGTYLSMKDTLDLEPVYEDDDTLLNPYGVIKVSGSLHNRDTDGAEAFYQWIVSDEAKALIADYKVDGETLFYPYD